MQRKGMNLLLAGIAAYGYYKFSKMRPEEKTAMKERARKFVNDNLGNLFGKRTSAKTGNS